MTEPLSAILCSVLAKAPNLKHLALNGKWKPTPSHTALIAIREHRGLEAVSWFSPSRTPVVSLFKGNTLPNLTTLVELRHDFGEDKEGLMNVSDALRFRSSSPHLTSIMLQTVLLDPCVAKVKKYVVVQDARPTLASYAGVEAEPSTGSWHDEDIRPQPYIETVFANSLRIAPDLVEVHFGHKYEGGYFPTHRRPTPLDGNLEGWAGSNRLCLPKIGKDLVGEERSSGRTRTRRTRNESSLFSAYSRDRQPLGSNRSEVVGSGKHTFPRGASGRLEVSTVDTSSINGL